MCELYFERISANCQHTHNLQHIAQYKRAIVLNTKRPVNKNLLTMSFPITAIASILHRISGVVLFLSIPLLLCGLEMSLRSEQEFEILTDTLRSPMCAFVLWAIVTAFIYHLIAGIRHLLMDMHIGESLSGGRIGAFLVLALSVVLSLMMGTLLW